MKSATTRLCFLAAALLIACFTASAQPPKDMTPSKPKPEFHNVAYGPHERNVLDLWTASSEKPAPLVIFFHGGGFVGGDKWTLSPAFLKAAHDKGIAVASANYRFSSHAPAPASMLDGALALQFLRAHAADYHIDPTRVGLCGSSAGAGISLWIGFHDDLADPKSADPVAKASTRVTALAVIGGQCSYHPRFIREVVGGRAWEHPALPLLIGMKPAEIDSPEADKRFTEASAITYLSKDDPPVFGWYIEDPTPLKPGPNTGPTLYYPDFGKEVPGADHPGQGIHHPRFGSYLHEQMTALGIECIIKGRADYPEHDKANELADADMAAFFARHFGL